MKVQPGRSPLTMIYSRLWEIGCVGLAWNFRRTAVRKSTENLLEEVLRRLNLYYKH